MDVAGFLRQIGALPTLQQAQVTIVSSIQ